MTSNPAAANADVAQVVLRPIRAGNAFEETVERLLQLLKLGLVRPGERLPPERDLAAMLAVSRVTLREAIRSLQLAGYVTSRRGRYGGTFVLAPPHAATEVGRSASATRPTSAEIDDVLLLRTVLETGAAEIAASVPVPAAARRRLADLLQEARSVSVEDYRPIDSRLHLLFAELTRSPSLVAAVADARMRVNDLLDEIPLLPRNIAHANDQHEAVASAILAGRPEEARTAMAEHLEGTAALLRGFLS